MRSTQLWQINEKAAEMRFMAYATLAAIVMLASPFLLDGDSPAVITGTVNHPSVKRYPTVVYIDETTELERVAPATHPIVEMTRKGFSPPVLPVTAGTTVRFRNGDTRTHNVFSLDGEKYDLGELKKGEFKEHTFTDAGIYAQLCSKHPQHTAYVAVLKTPYFAIADDTGQFRITGVPAGAWKLKVWNEALALSQSRESYSINAAAGQETKTQIAVPPLPSAGKFWLEPPPPAKAGLVDRGAWLYRQRGCFLCHGDRGSGGVRNRNYVKGTIPALDTLAERLMLFDPEDVRLILEQMERGRDLEALGDDPPVPRFEAVLAQYASVGDVIRKGSPAGKMHSKGPKPPLDMPRNKDASQQDIRALVAYLLSLQASEGGPE